MIEKRGYTIADLPQTEATAEMIIQHLLDDEPFELVSMRFPQFPIAIASLIMDECLDNRRGGSLIQTRIPDPLSLTSSYGPEME